MKYFEHVDLKQHFREFYRFFLPLFVFIFALVLAIWVTIKPKSSGSSRTGTDQAEKGLVGLLNPEAEDLFFDPAFAVLNPLEMVMAPRALYFDQPMGTEHAGLTYNAQPFMTTRHLGDDLNGIGGNNSDLDDPVYAVADGNVVYKGWPSDGWGNVIIILHELPDGRILESFYGHLNRSNAFVGQQVRRGQAIGSVGNAGGRYLAHLHFEMRTGSTLDCGAGYADAELDRLPGEFSLIKWRGRPDDMLFPALRPVKEDPWESLEVKTQP